MLFYSWCCAKHGLQWESFKFSKNEVRLTNGKLDSGEGAQSNDKSFNRGQMGTYLMLRITRFKGWASTVVRSLWWTTTVWFWDMSDVSRNIDLRTSWLKWGPFSDLNFTKCETQSLCPSMPLSGCSAGSSEPASEK